MGMTLERTDQFKSLLAETRTVAVVGACDEPALAAYYVPDYLHQEGFRIVPVNAATVGRKMWGELVRATLAEVSEPVDVVCIFRGSGQPSTHALDLLAMASRPNAVWLPPGVQDAGFTERMMGAGFDVVQDRCMAAEHKCAGLSLFG